MTNLYAWSLRGEKIVGDRKGRATEKLNIIAGMIGSRIISPMIYNCNTDSSLFNIWLERHLVPELPKNSLVVLDNAGFHKSAKTKEILKKSGHRLLFLPTYSPDLNPIEKFWAQLKAKIKNIISKHKSLSACVEEVFKTI